jgi:filamentous hemagglutinin
MTIEDHLVTASNGGGPAAAEYRATQRSLIQRGQLLDALKMDVDNIRTLFGQKYDVAIQQMSEYFWRMGQ